MFYTTSHVVVGLDCCFSCTPFSVLMMVSVNHRHSLEWLESMQAWLDIYLAQLSILAASIVILQHSLTVCILDGHEFVSVCLVFSKFELQMFLRYFREIGMEWNAVLLLVCFVVVSTLSTCLISLSLLSEFAPFPIIQFATSLSLSLPCPCGLFTKLSLCCVWRFFTQKSRAQKNCAKLN